MSYGQLDNVRMEDKECSMDEANCKGTATHHNPLEFYDQTL